MGALKATRVGIIPCRNGPAPSSVDSLAEAVIEGLRGLEVGDLVYDDELDIRGVVTMVGEDYVYVDMEDSDFGLTEYGPAYHQCLRHVD
jgi:hypothetical protein